MAKDLRDLAEGKPCYLRLHPFCRGNFGGDDTRYTVLCHFRVGGTGGTSLKPPDICGAPGCDTCHAVIDGKTQQKVYTPVQLRAEMLRAQNQWLEWLWKNEIVIVVAA